ncbi:peptidyl-prolyl cis-trans isomerase, FKBP-type [Arthrobacter sp. PAMC 25486]|uniref:FKBP-type peptidyl-prolyl cis-trans isomerase n=1 Tax=Arthrobacter sp. PAMC 25486 TaxID=1494608 RepID=UPI000535F32F|nr:peptidyl-prolyl cis-trans isomerase, FKBP-type [Arthrobacter sp. PAMC 25486]
MSIPPANAEALSSVKVEDQGKGKAPAVTFDKPLAITAESVKVVTEGKGEPVKAGQSVTLQAIGFNAEDGKTNGNSYSDPAGEKLVFDDAFKSTNPLVYTTFVGAKVGSFVAYAFPGTAAVEGSTAAPAQPAQPTVLTVFQIESAADVAKPLAKPEGETVTPPAGLPTVKDSDKGVPVITVGDAKAPTELIAQDLVTGKGPAVKATDTVVVNYVGVNFVGGEIFDSSFDRGTPFTTPLNRVIEGWTTGLTGKTVGSRVLLVVPKAMAYGDGGQGKAKGDLVFVVDILGVQ